MADHVQTQLNQIAAVFPHEITSVHVHAGDDFLIIEINGAWMFRFPRNEAAKKVLGYETRFLSRFRRLSPLPVPDYRYVGQGLVGYPKIEGVLLTPDLFRRLGPETIHRVARQVGHFLSALHTFPLAEAREIGLTEEWGGWRLRAAARFRKTVAPRLSAEARQGALDFLDQFLAMEWKRVVIHGDFYPQDHVFFDQARGEINGVIDFGDVTIGDAATDFSSILDNYGESFLLAVQAHYSGEIGETFTGRVKTRIAATPLFDASYALEYGFKERFHEHLAEIERAFGSGDAIS